MSYAIISLGGKQHRVREGEWLLVDRLPTEPGKTFNPTILMLGGDGNADFDAKGATVTVKVVEHVLGEKIRIGKYRPKNGYKRHNGYRSRLSKIEVQSISVKAAAAKAQPEPAEAEETPNAAAAAKPVATPKPAAKPKAAPKPRAPAVAEEKPEAPAVAEEKPKAPAKPKPAAAPKPAATAKPKPAAAAKPKAPAKPKPAAAAKPKAPARKPAPKKETDT
jgi:ribosomal protein L21